MKPTLGKNRNPYSLQPTAYSQSADLLFEIGAEELPAAYLPGLIEQLGREAQALLEASHLSFSSIKSYGTPRRLVLFVREVSTVQRKPGEEVRGPSKQASFDASGKPTPALLGFLRSQGGTLAHTNVVSTAKGDYVYLTKPPTATPTAKLLPTLLPQLIGRLRSPKTMRWDASGARFARPVRWLLARYGSAPVTCSFGTLVSQSATWLGRPQRLRRVSISSIAGYFAAVKRAGVLLDQDQRRASIERMVTKSAKAFQGGIAPEMISHGLLDEVTFLTEQPAPLIGQFDRAYLALPREVLLASMAKYQRVFSIEAGGALLPRCVAILEGSPHKLSDVRRVIERILNARLADSLLFWKDDHAHLPLERMAEGLAGVTFHEKLGSMADKAVRLRALAEPLAEAWRLTDEERQHLRRACQLAKADLVSTMVKEFPTLQGVVGSYYARDSGEAQPVADAIEEHYLPLGERLPRTVIGSALAIIEKYDTLTSYFALGMLPSGDQDPFGLRRAAQGIVEVAWKAHRPLPLGPLLRVRGSLPPFRGAQPKEIAAVGNQLQRYLLERLYTFAWPSARGTAPTPTDCIDAVLASPGDDLVDMMDRIVSLQQLNGHPGLLKAAKVVERTRNILRSATVRQTDVDPARLQEPLERQLWDLYRTHEPRVVSLAQAKSYAEATTLFGDVFFEPLHAFFDQVLVNVPDEALQHNRLALMRAIHALYTERIADLSKLAVLQHHHEEPS